MPLRREGPGKRAREVLAGACLRLARNSGAACVLATAAAVAAGTAQFEGNVVVEWLDDDPFSPSMRLQAPFAFRQADGTWWRIPAGHVLDTRSVPPLVLELAGSPFRGSARKAFVVYSHAAGTMNRPWDATQRMFFEAAVAEGVPAGEAQWLYALLRLQGPRWETEGSSCYGNCHAAGQSLKWWPAAEEDRIGDFLARAREPGTSLDDIDREAWRVMRGRGPHLGW